MGKKCVSVDIKNLMPSRGAVARKVQTLADKLRSKMLPDVVHVIRSGTCASTIGQTIIKGCITCPS